jgi:hypothetical protein
MDEKKCLDCGEKLVGRIDKKFCNDQCRNNYNNKLNSDTSEIMRNVNAILRKNRKILEEILSHSPEGKMTVNQRKVNDKGYNFNYFTNIYTTKTGKKYYFCYEYGYMQLENELLMLVKRSESI